MKRFASFLTVMLLTALSLDAHALLPYLRPPATVCDADQFLQQLTTDAKPVCTQIDYADLTGAPPATTPGGSDTYVQYNDGSAFGGDGGFRYNETANSVAIGGSAPVATNRLFISGPVGAAPDLTGTGVWAQQDIDAAADDYTAFYSQPFLDGGASPLQIVGFQAQPAAMGGGATGGVQFGFYAGPLSEFSANYGFYSLVPASASNFAFLSAGDARSQFGSQGIVLDPLAGTPSTLTNGAMWYDSTGSDLFGARINGVTRELQTGPLTGDVTTASGGVATTIATGAVTVAKLAATGTPSASTYHRGDDTWASVSGVGSPLANNGEIYVYAGSANAALAAPTPGQVILGAGTTNKLRWERGQDDQRYRAHFHEDFANCAQTTTTAGTLGSRIVTATANGAGVGCGFPGIGNISKLQFDIATTSPQQAGGAGLQYNGGGNRLMRITSSGLNLWRAVFLLVMPANAPDGTNNYVLKVGMSDVFSGAAGSNEFYVDLTNGTNSGKWVIRSNNVGVNTSSNTSATVCAVSTYCELSFELSGSTMTVYQNGTSIGTLTSSVSTSALVSPMLAITKTLGTASRTVWWEDFMWDTELTTPIY